MADQNDTPASPAWLRLADAAACLGVSATTLRRWSDAGRVPCFRSPGGHRRYRLDDLHVLLKASAPSFSDGVDRPTACHEPSSACDQPRQEQRPALADADTALRLQNLAHTAASGLDLPIVVIAWLVDSCTATILGAYPPEGAPSLGLSRGDLVPLRMIPLAGPTLSSGELLAVDDLSDGTDIGGPDVDYLRHVLGARTILAVPLVDGAKTAGVLVALGFSTMPRFSDSDLAFARQVAAQAASAHLSTSLPEPRLSPPQQSGTRPHEPRPPTEAPSLSAHTPPSSGGLSPSTPKVMTTTAHEPPSEQALVAAVDAVVSALGASSATLYRRRGEDWQVALDVPADPARDCATRTPTDTGCLTALDRMSLGAEPAPLAADLGGPALGLPIHLKRRQLGVLIARFDGALPDDAASTRPLIDLLAAFLAEHDAASALRRRIHELAGVIDATVEDRALLGYSATLRATAERLAALAKVPVVDIYALEGSAIRALVSYESGSFDPGWEGVVLPLDRYPCSKQAVFTRHMVSAASLNDKVLTPQGRSSLEKWGYQSQLSMPLVASGRVIGLAELSDRVPRDFLAERDVIQRLADVAAQTLEHAALFELMERRGRLTRELAELGASLAALHDRTAIAHDVCERLQRVLAVSRCSVFAVRDGLLWCLAVATRSGASGGDSMHPIPIDRNPTTAAALESGRPFYISDPADPRLSEAERSAFALAGYRSEALLPVAVQDADPAVIDLYDARARDFRESADFLRSAAHLLGSALHQVNLRAQLERRSAILNDIVELGAQASQVQPRDTVALLRGVARRLLDTIDATCCDIFTLDATGLHCRVSLDAAGFDESVRTAGLDLSKYPTTATALRSGEPFVVASPTDERLTDEERDNYRDFGFRSELGIPLVAGDRVVGLLDLFDTRPRDYAEYLDFARSVGQIVAGALENNLLLKDLDRSAAQQRLLVESALEFGASLDVEDVLRSVALRACAAAEADLCEIAVIEDERVRLLVSVSGEADTGDAGAVFPLAELAMIARTADTRTPQCRYDVETDPDVADDERAAWRRWGMRACARIPLLIGGRAIGVISLFARRPSRFERLPLLQGLAQFAAHAVANAELHRMLRARSAQAESLNALARRISASLDPTDVARTTIEELHGLLSFDVAAVVVLDENGSARLACEEPPLDHPDRLAGTIDSPTLRRLRLHGGDAASSSRSIDASQLDPALLARWPGLRAGLVAGLHDEGGPLGLLVLGRTTAAPYGAADRETLDRVATHLSLALTNARLYGGIRRLHLGNLRALTTALTARDDYTSGHARRVAGYMVLLGNELGWPHRLIEQVEECASLHDIGMIGVSDHALFGAGPLGAADRKLTRSHPDIGADILASLYDNDLVAAVRHHHERWDGDGYPAGLSGLEIPLLARAMSVADAYDAMSHQRPYREALNRRACRAELERCAGGQFDPEMVRAFLDVLDELDRQRPIAEEAASDAIALLSPDGRAPTLADLETDAHLPRTIMLALCTARDAHPPVRRLVFAVPQDGALTVLASVSADGVDAVPPSPDTHEETIAYLLQCLDDEPSDPTVLRVDRSGLWLSGCRRLLDKHGETVALVAADVAPVTTQTPRPVGVGVGVGDIEPALAAMLHSTAERLGRARLEAITDHLTGLYNHRYLHERLSEELERARESASPLSLLFIDIDRFKEFNDTYGHSAGDAALRVVGSALMAAVRRVDLAARYGGEEFLVVLVDTDAAGALEVAERIRTAIGAAAMGPDVQHVSVSIGVATFPDDAEYREELIDKADWAMYMAKRGGRDRVRSFSSGQLSLDLSRPSEGGVADADSLRGADEPGDSARDAHTS